MRIRVVTALVLLALVGTASAALIEPYHRSVSLQSTNFTTSITIPKFDTSTGRTLLSIEFILSGHVQGVVQFENEDANAATVIAKLQAELELTRPDPNSVLVVTIPVWDNSPGEDLPGYDGTTDFAGLSGRTYDDPNVIYGDKTETQTTSLSADLALFSTTTGETITLWVKGTGTSYASGPGNITSSFSTDASAEVTVNYYYIPEPGMMGLLTLGGLFGFRRRWLR